MTQKTILHISSAPTSRPPPNQVGRGGLMRRCQQPRKLSENCGTTTRNNLSQHSTSKANPVPPPPRPTAERDPGTPLKCALSPTHQPRPPTGVCTAYNQSGCFVSDALRTNGAHQRRSPTAPTNGTHQRLSPTALTNGGPQRLSLVVLIPERRPARGPTYQRRCQRLSPTGARRDCI